MYQPLSGSYHASISARAVAQAASCSGVLRPIEARKERFARRKISAASRKFYFCTKNWKRMNWVGETVRFLISPIRATFWSTRGWKSVPRIRR